MNAHDAAHIKFVFECLVPQSGMSEGDARLRAEKMVLQTYKGKLHLMWENIEDDYGKQEVAPYKKRFTDYNFSMSNGVVTNVQEDDLEAALAAA